MHKHICLCHVVNNQMCLTWGFFLGGGGMMTSLPSFEKKKKKKKRPTKLPICHRLDLERCCQFDDKQQLHHLLGLIGLDRPNLPGPRVCLSVFALYGWVGGGRDHSTSDDLISNESNWLGEKDLRPWGGGGSILYFLSVTWFFFEIIKSPTFRKLFFLGGGGSWVDSIYWEIISGTTFFKYYYDA